jgi:hypothetical protein
MRLSFRKGGDKRFYEILKRALQSKAWNVQTIRAPPKAGESGSMGIRKSMPLTSPDYCLITDMSRL